DEHVFVSTDKGVTWTDRVVANVQPGLACTAAGCPPDYYLGHHALAVDSAGTVVMLYDGATTAGGTQTVDAKRSTNKGVSWSSAVTLSVAGSEATDPTIEQGTAAGEFRAWYMQTTGTNVDQWNVYYRRSTDGGVTWSAAVDISDATGGVSYHTAAGFLEPYGDYGEIAVTSAGKTIATWGEGNSYTGPGGVWFNREP
ncbi:MAG: sialidase family protein, partial [Chloroflexota bacterium]